MENDQETMELDVGTQIVLLVWLAGLKQKDSCKVTEAAIAGRFFAAGMLEDFGGFHLPEFVFPWKNKCYVFGNAGEYQIYMHVPIGTSQVHAFAYMVDPKEYVVGGGYFFGTSYDTFSESIREIDEALSSDAGGKIDDSYGKCQ